MSESITYAFGDVVTCSTYPADVGEVVVVTGFEVVQEDGELVLYYTLNGVCDRASKDIQLVRRADAASLAVALEAL